MLISARASSLLLIDMQERLLPAMDGHEGCLDRCTTLIKAAKTLGLPVAVTEQYPKGLGPTVAALKNELADASVFAKLTFSAWRDAAAKQHFIGLHESDRPQIIVAGIEAHVCVLQTAVDLNAAGFGVFVVREAIASRAPASVSLAIERMRQSDVQIISTEMAIFELLGQAGTPAFKTLSALIR